MTSAEEKYTIEGSEQIIVNRSEFNTTNVATHGADQITFDGNNNRFNTQDNTFGGNNNDTEDDTFGGNNNDTKDDTFGGNNNDTEDDTFDGNNNDTKDDTFGGNNNNTEDDTFGGNNNNTEDDTFGGNNNNTKDHTFGGNHNRFNNDTEDHTFGNGSNNKKQQQLLKLKSIYSTNYKSKDFRQCLKIINFLRKIEPDDAVIKRKWLDCLYRLATQAWEKGNFSTSAIYWCIIDEFRQTGSGCYYLGQWYWMNNDISTAIEYFKKANQIKPMVEKYKIVLQNLLNEQNKFNENE